MVKYSFLEQQRKLSNCRGYGMVAGYHIMQIVDGHGFEPHQLQQRLELIIKHLIHFRPLHESKEYGVLRRYAEIVTGKDWKIYHNKL